MRINNYNKDTNVVANDKWIGSDFNNSGETKNFTPTNLAAYYNHNQIIDTPYLKFTYQTLLPGEVRAEGTISFVSEIGPSVPFSSISTFLVSNKSLKGNTISQYLNFLNGGKVILSRGENVNDFGFYKINNIQTYIPDPNFFTVTLQFISGNASMVEDKDYILSLLVDSQTINTAVTNTSDLINDGEDGIHPFITLQDLPPSNIKLEEVLINGNKTNGSNIKINNNDAIELENGSLLKKGSYSFGGNGNVSVSGISNNGDGYIAGIMGWGNPSGTQWSDLNGTYVKTSFAVTPSAYGAGDIGMHNPEPGTFNYYLQNPISFGTPDPTWNGIAYFLAPGNRSGWGDPNNNATTDPPVNYWRLCVLSDWPYTYFTNPSSDPYNFPTSGWVPVSESTPNSEGGNGATYLAGYAGGFTAGNMTVIGGDGGISRICSVGYEDMWQAGIKYVFDLSGYIREATNCFEYIPNNTFDNTQRFKIGSRWTLDNGVVYECKDATTGAAVWELVNTGAIPTLQSVTDAGNTTTNDIVLNNTVGEYGDYTVVNSIEDLGCFQQFSSPTNEDYTSYYAGYGFGIASSLNTYSNYIRGEESTFTVHSQDSLDNSFNGSIILEGTDGVSSAYLSIGNNLGYSSMLKSSNLTDDLTFQFPNKAHGEYTLATTSDIPSSSTFVPYTGATTNVSLGANSISGNQTEFNKYLLKDPVELNTGSMYLSGQEFFFYTSPTELLINTTYGELNLRGIDPITPDFRNAKITYQTLTADRTYALPNASGTIALTSNTVASVGATSPITSSGGNTPTISTSMATNKLIGRSTAGVGVMEEITIGSGLSLSAGTLTASGASPLTTKGDLYTYNSTNARLPVGLNTQVLIADSTTPTGLKWGSNTAATPTGYYGGWQDNVTQTAAASNIGYAMIFRTIDLANGISVVTNGTNLTRITFANTGVYNLQFSSQFQNTGNSLEDVTIWLRKNGTDVPGSSGFISVPQRKSASDYGHIVVSWNYLLDIVAGEYYELMWSTTNNTTVTMQYYAAGNPPPSTASVILTVTQQSGIMAGTGMTSLTTTGTSGASTYNSGTGALNVPTYTLNGLGGVPTSRTLTINGTAYDLTADRSWTITASGKSINVVSVNTNAGSASSTDYVYLASGTINITLPTAVGNQNLYTIKNAGTGVITVNTTSSQTIDGSLTAPIKVQYLSLTIISDGANWNII